VRSDAGMLARGIERIKNSIRDSSQLPSSSVAFAAERARQLVPENPPRDSRARCAITPRSTSSSSWRRERIHGRFVRLPSRDCGRVAPTSVRNNMFMRRGKGREDGGEGGKALLTQDRAACGEDRARGGGNEYMRGAYQSKITADEYLERRAGVGGEGRGGEGKMRARLSRHGQVEWSRSSASGSIG
jgi:hypothetical protein